LIIRLGAVNDGICDCCGGQDEWDGVVQCPDRCGEEADEARVEESKAMEGSRAREEYVRRAAALRDESRFRGVDGGPDNVFLAEAEGCHKLDDGDFTFEVCLFDRVIQHATKPPGQFKLGQKGNWATSLWENGQQRKDYSTLVMGDGEYCAPAKAPRRAEIHFECATTPKLISIQEAQLCVYKIHMQTPAACHSLQHHDDGKK
ncbi:unnamed protein product, partial [Polarella glacialis]